MKKLSEHELDGLLMQAPAPAPSHGFEERILNLAFTQKQKRRGDFLVRWRESFHRHALPSLRWQLSGAVAVMALVAVTNLQLNTASYDDEEEWMETIYGIDEMELLG